MGTLGSNVQTEALEGAIPSSLRRLFWEYDFDKLTWKKDKELVIFRVLAYGNWRETCWLLGQIGDEGVRAYMLRTRGRGLSRPQLRYWETILNLRHDLVTTWLSVQERRIWDER